MTHYTANIIAVKTTGFTCVHFPTVVPLSFWQATTTGRETLYFNCRLISVSKSTIFPLLFDYFAMALLHTYLLQLELQVKPVVLLHLLVVFSKNLCCKFLTLPSNYNHKVVNSANYSCQ